MEKFIGVGNNLHLDEIPESLVILNKLETSWLCFERCYILGKL